MVVRDQEWMGVRVQMRSEANTERQTIRKLCHCGTKEQRRVVTLSPIVTTSSGKGKEACICGDGIRHRRSTVTDRTRME